MTKKGQPGFKALSAKTDPYKGPLAKRIRLDAPSDDTAAAAEDKEMRPALEALAKVPILMEFFGIDPNSENPWMMLSLALAVRHVPGFRFDAATKPPGRPRSHPSNDILLVFDVERKAAESDHSIKNVCRLLAKLDYYKTQMPAKDEAQRASSLRRRYNRARKGWAGDRARELLNALKADGKID